MSTPYYTRSFAPSVGSRAAPSVLEREFDSVETGFSTAQSELTGRAGHALNLFRFCTDAQITSWLAGDLVEDFTVPMQALFDACSSGSGYLGYAGEIPPGRGKVTSNLRSKSKYIHIRGAGMWQSQVVYSGVAAGCIVADAMPYWSPLIEDFSIIGDASSGHGIDNSAITSDCYDGGIRNMYIEAGKAAIYFPKYMFHFDITNVRALSYTDHVFRVKMGNTTVMRGCYAVSAPAGKCGYRLAGNIRLDQCNGVDSLGIWGIFGSNTAGTDGWQGDFATTDYPAVWMTDCNVEAFTVAGLIIVNSLKSFAFEGGKIDRSAFSTDYHSVIWAMLQGQTQAPIVLDVDTYNAGGDGTHVPPLGQAKGGSFSGGVWTPGALTNAQFHAAAGCWFEDRTGQVAAGLASYNFTGGFYHDSYAHVIPFLTHTATADVNGDPCHVFNAVRPRRLTVEMLRYRTPVALTPVGSDQTIDVTGYTKVIVSPGLSASVKYASFTTTQYSGLDYSRNGDLIIEAGNANLTLRHTARGGAADTFVLTGAADLPLASGQIVRFLRSETGNQWQQV